VKSWNKKTSHPRQAPFQAAEPHRAGWGPIFSYNRLFGVAILALGLYLASDERVRIVRTGHAGRKSAVVPLLICMGLAYGVDPDFRHLAFFTTMAVMGLVGGVVWFVLWQ